MRIGFAHYNTLDEVERASWQPCKTSPTAAERDASGFDYSLDFKTLDFRKHPELYRIGRGEQGVLSVEPYKGEILPHWRFKTPPEARANRRTRFTPCTRSTRQAGDFVGMDMARKFIQMGYTRARRYANHPGGRKYKPGTREILPFTDDPTKAAAAKIFQEKWFQVRDDAIYQQMTREHRAGHSS